MSDKSIPAPAQRSLRESVARIVEPEAWANLGWRKRAGYDTSRDTKRSLRKASAILAIPELAAVLSDNERLRAALSSIIEDAGDAFVFSRALKPGWSEADLRDHQNSLASRLNTARVVLNGTQGEG